MGVGTALFLWVRWVVVFEGVEGVANSKRMLGKNSGFAAKVGPAEPQTVGGGY